MDTLNHTNTTPSNQLYTTQPNTIQINLMHETSKACAGICEECADSACLQKMITEVIGSDNGVEEDDAAMCITNHTNQSIYYFMTPRYHDHNEMFQDDICDAYDWPQVMISMLDVISI